MSRDAAPSATSDPLDPFLRWLLVQAGLNPAAYRAKALHRRLPGCLRGCRATSTGEAQKLLDGNPRLIAATLDRALIGVTAFFRDPKIFADLRELVLAELLDCKPTIRICSIGTADGQELISVAIVLAELGILSNCKLVGIDCRPGAIQRARTGHYDDAAVASLRADLRDKYFVPERDRWKLCPELRRFLHWGEGDALTFHDSEPWDVILFRNVAIYLEPDAAAHAWKNLAAQVRPGGCIVTTAAEKPPSVLGLQRLAPAIYRCP